MEKRLTKSPILHRKSGRVKRPLSCFTWLDVKRFVKRDSEELLVSVKHFRRPTAKIFNFFAVKVLILKHL
jgi:hypothetical protein